LDTTIVNVLLFANGLLNHSAMVTSLLDSLDSPRVICADGGALHARALGLTPHTIIGDLDSLSEEQVAEFKAAGAEIIQHPPEKDETDLELALYHCWEIGAKSIHILGALGGRIDQTIANILLLTQPAIDDIDIEVIDGNQVIRPLQPGDHRIAGERGDTISLIPLSAAAEGISTRGLRYPLQNETLRLGPARGLSNVMLAESAVVEFTRGLLLLVHTGGRA
jgi:thiamine pyrophosphokinase